MARCPTCGGAMLTERPHIHHPYPEAQAMTEDRLEAIREFHVLCEAWECAAEGPAITHCLCHSVNLDGTMYPCETAIVIEAMDGALAAVRAERDAARHERDAARKRLAALGPVAQAALDWASNEPTRDEAEHQLALAVQHLLTYDAAHRSLR